MLRQKNKQTKTLVVSDTFVLFLSNKNIFLNAYFYFLINLLYCFQVFKYFKLNFLFCCFILNLYKNEYIDYLDNYKIFIFFLLFC